MPPIGLGDPGWIAREQLVVFRRAQEADDAELDDEVVDDLLRLSSVSVPAARSRAK
jgi:hypothetical protein